MGETLQSGHKQVIASLAARRVSDLYTRSTHTGTKTFHDSV